MMKRLISVRLLPVLFLLLLCAGQARGEYQFRHYDRNNGLSDNTVNAIVQDDMGFMWFGTKYGLNRFDGSAFKNYYKQKDAHSLGNDYVNTLHVDGRKEMWVGTSAGVYIYSPVTDSFRRFSARTLEGDSVAANVHLIVGHGSKIYMATQGQGLFCYDVEKDELRRHRFEGLPNVTSIAFDGGNRIWLGFYGRGLYYSDNALATIKPLLDGEGNELLGGMAVNGIVPTEQNLLYVGTETHGLIEVNLDSRTSRGIFEIADGNRYVHSVLRCDNTIWAATEAGIYVYELLTHELQHYGYEPTNPFCLSDNPTQTVYRDRNGGIWAGTYFGGINYAPRRVFVFDAYIPRVDVPNSLHGRRVRDIVEDKNGIIWVGTEDGGLNRFNPKTKTFEHIAASQEFPNIHGLCCIGETVWVGSFSSGLHVIDIATGRLLKSYRAGMPGTFANDNIFTIHQFRDGQIYVGTFSGLYAYDDKADGFEIVKGLPANLVYDMLEDRKGQQWVVVYGLGIYKRQRGSAGWVRYSSRDEKRHLSSDNIVSIMESTGGDIWITMEGGGVNLYDPKTDTFAEIEVPSYQPRRVVFRIVEDDKQQLWMSTSDGLLCYNPQTKACRVYTTANGLFDNNFNYSSSLYASDGYVYMGTLGGLVSFKPESETARSDKPKIVATELLINNAVVDNYTPGTPLAESITYTRRISLSHDQNTFSLKVSVLNFDELTSGHIEYMLEGFDTRWLDLHDDNHIKYTNLPSGHYTLRVRMQPADATSASEYQLSIIVRPPLYATWWAWSLYLLVIAAIATFIYRWLNQRSRLRRKIAMEKFQHEKEQELYQSKINFFTNVAHEIRTPLSLIKGPLETILRKPHDEEEKEDLSIMDQNVSRLLELTNQLLDFRRTEQSGLKLNFERSNIGKLTESVYVRFTTLMKNRGIEGQLMLPEQPLYGYVDKEAYRKIISNLINNAVKYCEKYVRVTLSGNEENIVVVCENDGPVIPQELRDKIFTPFFRADSAVNTATPGSGIGLALAHTLAELHTGTLSIDDSMQLNIFRLTLPLHQTSILPDAETPSFPLEEQGEVSPLEEAGEQKEERETVLIVEDNQQMLHYQRRVLQTSYHVLMATDGQQALEVLAKNDVDIIISDAMMEPMGGFELCRQLKHDVNYSHIPFILLTALTLDSAKVEGMESGADSYIEKPFSVEYLVSVMQNLLRQREGMRQAYASSPFAQLDATAVSHADEEFVQRLQKVVSENLSDSDFDIASLSEQMFMSRTNLNRKIKGIYNLTPNNYIKLERLKRAAQMLKTNQYKINEVSYMVGFTSPSYFTQCFYKQFGLLPKDFIDNSTNQTTKQQ